MADAVSIIIALTGLIVTVYMCMKSVKQINSPCFKITVDGDTQDASLIGLVSHYITPRKVERAARDIENITQIIEEQATQSTKK